MNKWRVISQFFGTNVTLLIKERRFRNRGKLFYTEFDLEVS